MQERAVLTFAATLALLVGSGCIPQVDSGIPPFGSGSSAASGPPYWVTKAPMPTPRDAAAAAVVNGKIYVIGGSNLTTHYGIVEIYDPATDSWTTGSPIPAGADLWELSVATINGIIYVFGGLNAASSPQSTVLAYDPSQAPGAEWTNCGGTCDPLPSSATQGAQSTAVTAGGAAYMIGGNATGILPVSRFDPSQAPSAQWTTCGGAACTTLGAQRNRSRAVVVGNTIYNMGGYDGGGFVADLEAYSISGNAWTNCGGTCPPMNLNGMDPAAHAIGTTFYVFAPEVGTPSNFVDSFDTTSLSWTQCGGTCPSKPTAVTWPTAVVIGNEIHIIGGDDSGGATGAHEVFVVP